MDKWTRRPCLRCLGESLGALGCMQAQKMGGRLLGWAVVTWQIVTARSNFLRETDNRELRHVAEGSRRRYVYVHGRPGGGKHGANATARPVKSAEYWRRELDKAKANAKLARRAKAAVA